MERIQQYRQEINELDEQMAQLFKKRMEVSRRVAEYKMDYGLPVKDASREEQIYDACAERIGDPEIEPYYVNLQKKIIELSCKYQASAMEGLKVSYSGVEGAFAYMAAKKLFPDAKLISCPNFESAYKAVTDGETDFAVLPIENSYAGDVGTVMDLAFEGPLYINRICNLNIEQCLAAPVGSCIKDINTVISHPQALAQCEPFIREHELKTVEYVNTARAAEYVKELNDRSTAAICSEAAANIFGLDILERGINAAGNNTSRFAVFSRKPMPGASLEHKKNSFIIVFSLKNEAGALALTLDILGSHRYNLKNLKSRPLKGTLWEYYFYIEAEGDITDENGRSALRELAAVCGHLKLLGAYIDDNE